MSDFRVCEWSHFMAVSIKRGMRWHAAFPSGIASSKTLQTSATSFILFLQTVLRTWESQPIMYNPNCMQASLHCFTSHFHKTLLTRGIYSEPASPGLYPPHIALPVPHAHFPYLQTPKCQSRSKLHSTGKADWSGYLEISIFLKRRQVNILPGALAQHTWLPQVHPEFRVLQEKVLQFHCASFPSLLPSQLTGGCLQGGQELSAHPLPCQEGWILHIPDTPHDEFTTWQSKRKGLNSGQSIVKDREMEQKREEGECTGASTTSKKLDLLDFRFLAAFR